MVTKRINALPAGTAVTDTSNFADEDSANGNVTQKLSALQFYTYLLSKYVGTPLTVPQGGTGLAALTEYAILLGAGGSPINPVTLTDGQILIGSTSAQPVAATLAAGSGISIINGAGSITLESTASPTGWTPGFILGGQMTWVEGSPSDVTMAVVQCSDSTDNYKIVTPGVLTYNHTTTDNGVWAAGGGYYAYVADNPAASNPIPILSLNSTTPDLSGHPGYTIFRRVGYIQGSSAGLNQINGFQQDGNSNLRSYNVDSVDDTILKVLTAGGSTTGATIFCGAAVPNNTRQVLFKYVFTPTGIGESFTLFSTTNTAQPAQRIIGGSVNVVQRGMVSMFLDGSQDCKYLVSNAGATLDLYVAAFVDNI